MRILISSLQVSTGASKGHFHPAVAIGLELKLRGHQVGILPLPSNFSEEEKALATQYGFELLTPPSLPDGLLHSPQALAQLAKDPTTISTAYRSFLVDPLSHQIDEVIKLIELFAPDFLVYDLFNYAAAIAARLLKITDIGFCSGLKLIADIRNTIFEKLHAEFYAEIISIILKYGVSPKFKNLELLSNNYNIVFAPPKLRSYFEKSIPAKTILAGPLLPPEKFASNDLKSSYLIVCFGSVHEVTLFPEILACILNIAKKFKRHLFIASKNLTSSKHYTVLPYLPLQHLLKNADMIIHHGGANTFAESFVFGIPQIVIPIGADQPIQAHILKKMNAGFAFYPDEITEEKLQQAFATLLDINHEIHKNIKKFKKIFRQANGAKTICNLIEILR